MGVSFYIFFIIIDKTIKHKNINISILIREILNNILLARGVQGQFSVGQFCVGHFYPRRVQGGEGEAFLFSLLLEIGISDININISVLFKEIQ